MVYIRLLFAAAFAGAHDPEGDIHCPGSPATQHAWLTLSGTAEATCDEVRAEMLARVDGQGSTWVDPHNAGTYRGVLNSASTSDVEVDLELERVSANTDYTDRMLFTFTDGPDGSCTFTGCSESQGMSASDQSTNYCNLWNMFCGTAEECCPARYAFATAHVIVASHQSAGRNANICLGGSGGSGQTSGGERQTSCLTTLDSDESSNADVAGDNHTHGPDGDHAAHDAQMVGEVDSDEGSSADVAGDNHTHGPDGDHAAHGVQTVGEVSRAGRAAHSVWWCSSFLFLAAGIWC